MSGRESAGLLARIRRDLRSWFHHRTADGHTHLEQPGHDCLEPVSAGGWRNRRFRADRADSRQGRPGRPAR